MPHFCGIYFLYSNDFVDTLLPYDHQQPKGVSWLRKRSASKDLLVSIGRRSFDSHSLPQDDKSGRLDYCFGVLYRRGRVSRPWDFAKQNPIAARQSMVISFGKPENANIFGWDGKPVPYGVD